MPHLIDAPRILPHHHLARDHTDVCSLRAGTLERGQPSWFRLGIVIEQRDELPPRSPYALIVRRAESPILPISNHLRAELAFRQLRRSVARPIVHHDRFEG